MKNRVLSAMKLFSLTTGTLAFMLVWLFYIDYDINGKEPCPFLLPCSPEGLVLLFAVLFIMVGVYLLLICNQIAMRTKEFFFRKYYGAATSEIVTLILTEAVLFLTVAFLLSLILIDQLAPFFNTLTARQVSVTGGSDKISLIVGAFIFMIPGFIIMLLPAVRCARYTAAELLRKMR